MKKHILKVFCGLIVMATVTDAFAAQVARSGVAPESVRSVGATTRASKPTVNPRSGATRATRNVAVRTAITPAKPNRETTSPLTRARNIISKAGNEIINRAWGLSRSATTTSARVAKNTTPARSAAVPTSASRARATAVFSDTSLLGENYNNCRQAYNTCMDQFCAGANETYRRCFCSDGFRTLRDKEEALDAATTMLSQFESNNLNAVDKTAEEVNAMYSATAGEMAIKKDTSASAALLNDIGDLLSGKKKPETNKSQTSLSALDFSVDLGDIWADNSATSIFGGGESKDLASMEGTELYNNAHNQCMQLIGNTCEAGAVKNMAKSAYSILITQDCNAYQKKLDTKTEQVKSTVRTAEKYLREARLEEYRAHNSADVNECLDKVETAILAPTACGTDFVKCLDYSGVYINSSTGEAIYSPRLFKLNELIVLDGTSADVLSQNPEFNNFLDSKRVYAKTALDSCRDYADTVWTEFKRNALIKISQAQDEKIEEVKMSCVSTMKECYDTQSGALKSFDDTTAQASGALAARASHDMCSDKVLACATLYGDVDGCSIDTKTNKVTAKNGKKCGLSSLVNFVNAVDDTRIAEGCGAAVESYLKKLCTPSSGEEGYPWNCRLRNFGNMNTQRSWSDASQNNGKDLITMVVNYAIDNCGDGDTSTPLEVRSQNEVILQLEGLREDLGRIIGSKCEAADGIWVDADSDSSLSSGDIVDGFYSVNFGKSYAKAQQDYLVDSWGKCLQNTVKARCDAENKRTGDSGYATYDDATGQCRLTVDYYKYQCEQVMGIWTDDNHCYIEK
ncbi:MAG: hypothetical protein IJS34_00565 [Alphaproteobacteria bacterium]|nr:hypothetical protein [Alphaproteobacteria bacterium]